MLLPLLQPTTDNALEIFPVSPQVNNIRNNGSQLVLSAG